MGYSTRRAESFFYGCRWGNPFGRNTKLLAAIEAGNDVAIGSRVIQQPGEVEIRTSLHRRFMGRCFAFVVNLFAFEGIADTQCGFKMFRRQAAAAIFSRQKIVGFAFDVEILFIANRLLLSIAEIPVNWVAQPGSKVNLVTDSTRMLWISFTFDGCIADSPSLRCWHRRGILRN